jgi:inner membrane protein
MEPVTHFLTGACLARAGFNRKAAYATLAMTLAAEAPDLDTLWAVRGPVAAFQHHRGITHTFLGLPFEGLIVLGFVWLIHRWRLRPSSGAPPTQSSPAPLRWGLLYLFILVALLSHILLDWTNNYGVRPFFPFNPRWYEGSFVFIFEPVMFLLLLLALIAPALTGLVNAEIGARRAVFRGRGWAIVALAGIAALWGWRWVEHDNAVQLAANANYGAPGSPSPQILRIDASPHPGNPYRWHTVVDTGGFYQIARVDTLHDVVDTNPEQDLLSKPHTSAATEAAEQSQLGRAYLDWSSWPLVADIGPATPEDAPPDAPLWTGVSFRDLRFQYETFLSRGGSSPLAAMVYVDSSGHVQRTQFGPKR